MKLDEWIGNRDAFIQRMGMLEKINDLAISNRTGSVVVRHGQYPAFEGEGADLPYAVLAMCSSGGGRTRREMNGVVLDDVWRPGRVGVILPGPAGKGFTPDMGMLGIAFDLEAIPACHGRKIAQDELLGATTSLFDDPLLSAVMVAIWHDAELHGTSTPFFEHSLSLVVHRLGELAGVDAQENENTPPNRLLKEALLLIEDNLDGDLNVRGLARAVALSPRSFTRAFKKETGYTPFAYITKTRMEKSRLLLRQDYMSITQIAASVGYSNPAKFSAAFRRWTGCSPSEWRR